MSIQGSNSRSNHKQTPIYHVALEIEHVLAHTVKDYSFEEVEKSGLAGVTYIPGPYLGTKYRHYLLPGAIEFVRLLYSLPNVQPHFYSRHKDSIVYNFATRFIELALSSEPEKYADKIRATKSLGRSSLYKCKTKTEKNSPPYSSFSSTYKKKLQLIVQDGNDGRNFLDNEHHDNDPDILADLNYCVLIDNERSYIYADQIGNLLYSGCSDFAYSVRSLHREKELKCAIDSFFEVNHIFYIASTFLGAYKCSQAKKYAIRKPLFDEQLVGITTSHEPEVIYPLFDQKPFNMTKFPQSKVLNKNIKLGLFEMKVKRGVKILEKFNPKLNVLSIDNIAKLSVLYQPKSIKPDIPQQFLASTSSSATPLLPLVSNSAISNITLSEDAKTIIIHFHSSCRMESWIKQKLANLTKKLKKRSIVEITVVNNDQEQTISMYEPYDPENSELVFEAFGVKSDFEEYFSRAQLKQFPIHRLLRYLVRIGDLPMEKYILLFRQAEQTYKQRWKDTSRLLEKQQKFIAHVNTLLTDFYYEKRNCSLENLIDYSECFSQRHQSEYDILCAFKETLYNFFEYPQISPTTNILALLQGDIAIINLYHLCTTQVSSKYFSDRVNSHIYNMDRFINNLRNFVLTFKLELQQNLSANVMVPELFSEYMLAYENHNYLRRSQILAISGIESIHPFKTALQTFFHPGETEKQLAESLATKLEFNSCIGDNADACAASSSITHNALVFSTLTGAHVEPYMADEQIVFNKTLKK